VRARRHANIRWALTGAALLVITSFSWGVGPSTAAGAELESLCDITAYPTLGPGVDTALGPDGNVWFTDLVTLGKVTPSGRYTIYSRGFAEVNFLGGITAGPDGNMWFTE
jgi:virginiamycin B lyase